MRKFLAVLLVLAMLLAVGCSGKAPAGSTGETSTTSTAESSEDESSKDGVGLGDVLSAVGDLLDGNELPTLELDGKTYTYGDKIDLEAMAEKYPDARWGVARLSKIEEMGISFRNRGWPIAFDEDGGWLRETDDEPDPWIACIYVGKDSKLELGGIRIGDTYEDVMKKYPMASSRPGVDVETEESFDLVVSYLNGKPEPADVCNWFIDAISLGDWAAEKGREYVYRVYNLSPVLMVTIKNGVVASVCLGDRISIYHGN